MPEMPETKEETEKVIYNYIKEVLVPAIEELNKNK